MNSSIDPQEQIRRLLAVKRHERPPPGFFNSFSQKIIARIEAEALAGQQPRWRLWIAELTQQPLLASIYGLLFAGLLIVAVGVAYSSPGDSSEPLATYSPLISSPPTVRAEINLTPMGLAPADTMLPASSTTPVFSPFPLPSLPVERASTVWP